MDAAVKVDRGEGGGIVSPIEEIVEDAKRGKMFILVDEEDRENEGDLVIPAEYATPDIINFMAREGRGLICLAMDGAMIDRLGLDLMERRNESRHGTAFTLSIEAREGISTGISAADRAHTIRTAIDPAAGPANISTPGHVFPLRARDGGVLVRAGHTEAAVDLARLAGCRPSGVICEIMNDDGTMARLPDLARFAARHDLKIGTIADLIAHRRRTERLVDKVHSAVLSSIYGGEFMLHIYASKVHGMEHMALVKGDVENAETPVCVRMHALDPVRDVLGGGDGSILHGAMAMIGREDCGVVVLLRGTGGGPLAGEGSAENAAAPLRDYGIGAQILLDLGIKKMILLTNHPKTVVGLEGYGLEIQGYRPVEAGKHSK